MLHHRPGGTKQEDHRHHRTGRSGEGTRPNEKTTHLTGKGVGGMGGGGGGYTYIYIYVYIYIYICLFISLFIYSF